VTAFDDAVAAARRTGRDSAVGRQLQNCGVALRQAGRLDRALAMTREGAVMLAAGTASEGGGEGGGDQSIAQLIVARDEIECGHYAGALSTLEGLLSRFEAMSTPLWLQARRLVLATMWLHLGQPAPALPMLRNEPAGLPAWLRADRRLRQLELAQALRQQPPTALRKEVLALAERDLQRGPALRMRAFRFAPADAVPAQAEALAAPLRSGETPGRAGAARRWRRARVHLPCRGLVDRRPGVGRRRR